ncbi:hypothetical protein ZIOFF_048897 [Zingiber officinale]|uniref:Uncharacterized protein n=1 Tax=Zingiber officinale TaxID=94328 RepID=A0A8J5KY18_ZINOF|nr:hypothetical protein ZIOFF_048897 [Zingiber officinale]
MKEYGFTCGGSVDVRQLRWGEDEDAAKFLVDGRPAFDAVLASDVVYYDHLIDPLLRTLRGLVKGEVVFVMVHLKRWKNRDAVFFRKARKLNEGDWNEDMPRTTFVENTVAFIISIYGSKSDGKDY